VGGGRIHGDHQVERSDERRRLGEIRQGGAVIGQAVEPGNVPARWPDLQADEICAGDGEQWGQKLRPYRPAEIIGMRRVAGPDDPDTRAGRQFRFPCGGFFRWSVQIALSERNRLRPRAEYARQAHLVHPYIELRERYLAIHEAHRQLA
jgi:hypothetical protein